MAKGNSEYIVNSNGRVKPNAKQNSQSKKTSNSNGNPPSPSKGEVLTKRLSPTRVHQSVPAIVSSGHINIQSSPRISPGLIAGHYAGCKWTEPPSPSALPLPPQHWMQTAHSVMLPFHRQSTKHDIAQQLKVLLKVHA